jgi:hypothetical protein
MTKNQSHSVTTIKRALEVVENDISLELKRYSKKRHKNINKAFETIRLHLSKLGIGTGHLKSLIGVYYSPENNKKYFEGLQRVVESNSIFKE